MKEEEEEDYEVIDVAHVTAVLNDVINLPCFVGVEKRDGGGGNEMSMVNMAMRSEVRMKKAGNNAEKNSMHNGGDGLLKENKEMEDDFKRGVKEEEEEEEEEEKEEEEEEKEEEEDFNEGVKEEEDYNRGVKEVKENFKERVKEEKKEEEEYREGVEGGGGLGGTRGDPPGSYKPLLLPE